jgi:hypothetical protein
MGNVRTSDSDVQGEGSHLCYHPTIVERERQGSKHPGWKEHEFIDQEKEQTWIYFCHLEGIHQWPGEIIALSWESEQIICSSSTTGATHRWLAQQAIHLATPVVVYCLRPQLKEVPHG